jgi:hypothetical protein
MAAFSGPMFAMVGYSGKTERSRVSRGGARPSSRAIPTRSDVTLLVTEYIS